MAVFLGGEVAPVPFLYGETAEQSWQENGPVLDQPNTAFESGVEVLTYSTPSNPTGAVVSDNWS